MFRILDLEPDPLMEVVTLLPACPSVPFVHPDAGGVWSVLVGDNDGRVRVRVLADGAAAAVVAAADAVPAPVRVTEQRPFTVRWNGEETALWADDAADAVAQVLGPDAPRPGRPGAGGAECVPCLMAGLPADLVQPQTASQPRPPSVRQVGEVSTSFLAGNVPRT